MDDARMAEIDDEIARLRAELDPLEARRRERLSEIDSVRRLMRPIEERIGTLTEERQRLDEAARWRSQATPIAEAWAAYLRGERATILLAMSHFAEPKSGNVATPARHAGPWAVHPTLDERIAADWPWTLTHGPSGMSAYRGRSEAEVLALAAQLLAIAPDLDTDPVTGRPRASEAHAAAIREHRAAMGGA